MAQDGTLTRPPTPQDSLLDSKDFASLIRQTTGSTYGDLDDDTLTHRVLTEYPQYKDMVRPEYHPQPEAQVNPNQLPTREIPASVTAAENISDPNTPVNPEPTTRPREVNYPYGKIGEGASREVFIPPESGGFHPTDELRNLVTQKYGRVASYGQGNIHNKMGWDHRRAMDVALHPQSKAGQEFITYLRENNIPYQAFTKRIVRDGRIVASGPHIHVGLPSKSTQERYPLGTISQEPRTDFQYPAASKALSSPDISNLPNQDASIISEAVPENIPQPRAQQTGLDPQTQAGLETLNRAPADIGKLQPPKLDVQPPQQEGFSYPVPDVATPYNEQDKIRHDQELREFSRKYQLPGDHRQYEGAFQRAQQGDSQLLAQLSEREKEIRRVAEANRRARLHSQQVQRENQQNQTHYQGQIKDAADEKIVRDYEAAKARGDNFSMSMLDEAYHQAKNKQGHQQAATSRVLPGPSPEARTINPEYHLPRPDVDSRIQEASTKTTISGEFARGFQRGESTDLSKMRDDIRSQVESENQNIGQYGNRDFRKKLDPNEITTETNKRVSEQLAQMAETDRLLSKPELRKVYDERREWAKQQLKRGDVGRGVAGSALETGAAWDDYWAGAMRLIGASRHYDEARVTALAYRDAVNQSDVENPSFTTKAVRTVTRLPYAVGEAYVASKLAGPIGPIAGFTAMGAVGEAGRGGSAKTIAQQGASSGIGGALLMGTGGLPLGTKILAVGAGTYWADRALGLSHDEAARNALTNSVFAAITGRDTVQSRGKLAANIIGQKIRVWRANGKPEEFLVKSGPGGPYYDPVVHDTGPRSPVDVELQENSDGSGFEPIRKGGQRVRNQKLLEGMDLTPPQQRAETPAPGPKEPPLTPTGRTITPREQTQGELQSEAARRVVQATRPDNSVVFGIMDSAPGGELSMRPLNADEVARIAPEGTQFPEIPVEKYDELREGKTSTQPSVSSTTPGIAPLNTEEKRKPSGLESPNESTRVSPDRSGSSNLSTSPSRQPGGIESFPAEKKAEAKTRGEELTWQEFPHDMGSLNIPRAEMPQIKSEHRGAMVQFLKGKGIDWDQEEVLPGTLKPTQQEFSPEKVNKARDWEGPNRPILVSSDNYVADGHHQWMKAFDTPLEKYPIIRLHAPIKELLPLLHEFPSSSVDTGTEASKPLPNVNRRQQFVSPTALETPETPLSQQRTVGEHGMLSSYLRHQHTHSETGANLPIFVHHPALNKILGLPPLPEYATRGEEGKTHAAAVQETLDKIAEEVAPALRRKYPEQYSDKLITSSHIGPEGFDYWIQKHMHELPDDLVESYIEAAHKYELHQENRLNFIQDPVVQEILKGVENGTAERHLKTQLEQLATQKYQLSRAHAQRVWQHAQERGQATNQESQPVGEKLPQRAGSGGKKSRSPKTGTPARAQNRGDEFQPDPLDQMWKNVESKDQKEKFLKDSYVQDPVYHVSNQIFDYFDPTGKSGTPEDEIGSWFTPDLDLIEERLDQLKENAPRLVIYPVYLRLIFPRIFKSRDDWKDYFQSFVEKHSLSPEDAVIQIREQFQDKGHDGLLIENDLGFGPSYVVFSSNQVRSINAKFEDLDSTDILAKKPEAQFEGEPRRLGGAFYSPLYRALDTKMQSRMRVEQVRNIIKDPQNRVKADEVKWTFLDNFLEGKESVSKQEVLDYVRDNYPKIQEVIKTSYQGSEEIDSLIKQINGVDEFSAELFVDEEDIRPYVWWEGEQIETERDLEEAFQRLSNFISEKYEQELDDGADDRELMMNDPAYEGLELVSRLFDAVDKIPAGQYIQYGDKDLRLEGEIPGTYKEAILTLQRNPQDKSGDYSSAHWEGLDNPVVHVRYSEFLDENNKPFIVIHEVQSDLHQAGHQEGYKDSEKRINELPAGYKVEKIKPEELELQGQGKGYRVGIKGQKVAVDYILAVRNKDEAKKQFDGFVEDYKTSDRLWKVTNPEGEVVSTSISDRGDAIKKTLNLLNHKIGLNTEGVPPAPFKDTWPELAIRYMIHQAVKQGRHRIDWTPGIVQVERYGNYLKQPVDKVEWEKGAKNVQVTASKGPASGIFSESIPLEGEISIHGQKVTLEKLLGKKMAQEIRESKETSGVFEGDDLSIGGHFYKFLYDERMVNYANKFVKQWGGKVEQGKVKTEDKSLNFLVDIFEIEDGGEGTNVSYQKTHSIKITPQMRKSASEDIPLFQPQSELTTEFERVAELENEELVNAAQYFLPSMGRARRVYVNPEMQELISAALDYEGQFNGVNLKLHLAAKVGNRLYELARKYPRNAEQLRGAGRAIYRNAERYGTANVQVLFGGKISFKDRATAAHEETHRAQIELGIDHINIEELEQHPTYLKAQPYLDKYQYSKAVYVRLYETFAHVAGGEWGLMGLTREEGRDFLKAYLESVNKKGGEEFLKKFRYLRQEARTIRNEILFRIREQRESRSRGEAEGRQGVSTTRGEPGERGGLSAPDVRRDVPGGTEEGAYYNKHERIVKRKASRKNLFGDDEPKTLTVFHSQLYRTIYSKIPNRVSKYQLLKTLSNPQNGVKKEELYWTGLDDYIETKEEFTKQELLDFLKQTFVNLEEKTLGSATKNKDLKSITKSQYGLYNIEQKINNLGYRLVFDPDAMQGGVYVDLGAGEARFDYSPSDEPLPDAEFLEVHLDDIKPPDIPESDLDEEKLEEYQEQKKLIDLLRKYETKLEEVRGTQNQTAYARWQAVKPSGENYRELLISFPGIKPYVDQETLENASQDIAHRPWNQLALNEQETIARLAARPKDPEFKGGHFSNIENVVFHIRYDDRATPDRKKVLLIQEFQSDWHQKACKKLEIETGLRIIDPVSKIAKSQTITLPQGYKGVRAYYINIDKKKGITLTIKDGDKETDYGPFLTTEKALNVAAGIEEEALPNAPFKKTWRELAFKRMLAYAVQNDYHALTWSTGTQQADLYHLRKVVDTVYVVHTKDNRYQIKAFNQGNAVGLAAQNGVNPDDVPRNDLSDFIGEDLTKKVRETEPNSKVSNIQNHPGNIEWSPSTGVEEDSPFVSPAHKFTGKGIEIGGHAMREAYDKILPQEINKLLKKLDPQAKIEQIALGEKTTGIDLEAAKQRLEYLETETVDIDVQMNTGSILNLYPIAVRVRSIMQDEPQLSLSDAFSRMENLGFDDPGHLRIVHDFVMFGTAKLKHPGQEPDTNVLYDDIQLWGSVEDSEENSKLNSLIEESEKLLSSLHNHPQYTLRERLEGGGSPALIGHLGYRPEGVDLGEYELYPQPNGDWEVTRGVNDGSQIKLRTPSYLKALDYAVELNQKVSRGSLSNDRIRELLKGLVPDDIDPNDLENYNDDGEWIIDLTPKQKLAFALLYDMDFGEMSVEESFEQWFENIDRMSADPGFTRHDLEEMQAFLRRHGFQSTGSTINQPGVVITEPIRDSVDEGLPLFSIKKPPPTEKNRRRNLFPEEPRYLGGGFYSQLYRQLSKLPETIKVPELKKFLSNPGNEIKKDEVIWTGVDDFIDGKETIKKQDLLNLIKAWDAPQETVLGGPLPQSSKVSIERVHELRGKVQEILRNNDYLGFDDYEEALHAIRTHDDYADRWDIREPNEIEILDEYKNVLNARKKANEVKPAQYSTSNYSLSGRDDASYRESLTNLPKRTPKPQMESREWKIEENPDGTFMLTDNWGQIYENNGNYLTRQDAERALTDDHHRSFIGADEGGEEVQENPNGMFSIVSPSTGEVKGGQMEYRSREDAQKVLDRMPKKDKFREKEQQEFQENINHQSGHFSGGNLNTNLLGWTRYDDRTTVDGESMLFGEEFQSDLHQQGRDKGYYQGPGKLPSGWKIQEAKIPAGIDFSDPKEIFYFDTDEFNPETENNRDVLPFLRNHDISYMEIGEQNSQEYRFKGPQKYLRKIVTDWMGGVDQDFDNIAKPFEKQDRPTMIDVFQVLDPEGNLVVRQAKTREEALKLLDDYPPTSVVPDMPFKNTWHELEFRKLVRKAVEQGKDRVGWTTGVQQVERWPNELRQKVDAIRVLDNEDGTFYIAPIKNGEMQGHRELEKVPKNKLKDYVGETIAQQVFTQPPQKQKNTRMTGELPEGYVIRPLDKAPRGYDAEYEWWTVQDPDGNPVYYDWTTPDERKTGQGSKIIERTRAAALREALKSVPTHSKSSWYFEGDDLTIGGEGMKTNYDVKMVSYARKFARKFDPKADVEKVEIGIPEHRPLEFSEKGKEYLRKINEFEHPMIQRLLLLALSKTTYKEAADHMESYIENHEEISNHAMSRAFELLRETQDWEMKNGPHDKPLHKVWSIKITPAMRESVEEGLPLFKKPEQKQLKPSEQETKERKEKETKSDEFGAFFGPAFSAFKSYVPDKGKVEDTWLEFKDVLIEGLSKLRKENPRAFAAAAKLAGTTTQDTVEQLTGGISAKRLLYANNMADLIRTLEQEGLAQAVTRAQPTPKTIHVNGRDYDTVMREIGSQNYVLPEWLDKELDIVLSPPDRYRDNVVQKAISSINNLGLASPLGAFLHTINLMSTLVGATPFVNKSFAGKTIFNTPVTKVFTAIVEIVRTDPFKDPDSEDLLRRLADLGVLMNSYGKDTYSKQFAAALGGKRKLLSFGPLLHGPKGIDIRARMLMARIALAINPNATDKELIEFINQMGVYNRQLESQVARVAKGSHLAPFFTAGSAMIRNAAKVVTGTTPMPTEGMSRGEKLKFRAYQQFSAGLLGLLALWILMSLLYRKQFPWDDKESRWMQIPVNPEDRESWLAKQLWGDDTSRTAYIGFGFFSPLVERGSRLLGISANYDTMMRGGTPRQGVEAGAVDTLNSIAHPFVSGPFTHAVIGATTGHEPQLKTIRDHGKFSPEFWEINRPKNSGIGDTMLSGALEINPLLADFVHNFLGINQSERDKKLEESRKFLKNAADIVAPRLIKNTQDLPGTERRMQREETEYQNRQKSDEEKKQPRGKASTEVF